MLEASVILNDSVKRSICCDDCGIKYSKAHYKILYLNRKLVYFDFTFPESNYLSCLCHGCLFENVKKITGGEPIQVKITCKGKEYLCDFFG